MVQDIKTEDIIDQPSAGFKKAKAGLQEHALALTALAQRTIAEAENICAELKAKTLKEAKAEANAVRANAEETAITVRVRAEEEANAVRDRVKEEAERIIEEKRLEALAIVSEEIEAIETNAQEMLRLHAELMSQLENLTHHITASGANLERMLSQLGKHINPANEAGRDVTRTTNSKVKTSVYEGVVDLEVLPPVVMGKIKEIIKYLNAMSEVDTTQLIDTAESAVIRVSLLKATRLAEVVRELPQVNQIVEVKDKDGRANGKPRKIQVSLWL